MMDPAASPNVTDNETVPDQSIPVNVENHTAVIQEVRCNRIPEKAPEEYPTPAFPYGKPNGA